MKDFIEKINSNYGVDKTAAEELLNNAEIIHVPKHSYLVWSMVDITILFILFVTAS